MANSFSFNGTDMSTYGLTVRRSAHEWIPEAQTEAKRVPGSDLSVASPLEFGVRTIAMEVSIRGATAAALITRRDTILRILNERSGAALALDEEPGRYWLARLSGASEFTVFGGMYAVGTLSFIALDPHGYASTETAATSEWPRVSWELTVGGSARAYPEVVFTASGAATVVIVDNSDTDERMSWTGSLASGEKVKFDCAAWKAYKYSGGEWALSMAGFEGRFISLAPGQVNNVRLIAPTAGTLAVTYRTRYL